MKYSGIIYDDISNGVGIRTSLFVSGCRNNCKGCFNKEQQNFEFGMPFTKEVEEKILESVKDEYYAGISILGGEPMEPENAKALTNFIIDFKNRYPKKNIWMYTGYTYEFLSSLDNSDPRKNNLMLVDVLVDGRFEEALKDVSLYYRGSSNQRIIDVKASIANHQIINYFN